MDLEATIDRLTTAINNSRPASLCLTATRSSRDAVIVRAELLHPLATVARDDSPQAIAAALADLFDGLAEHIRVTTAAAGDSEKQNLASAVDS